MDWQKFFIGLNRKTDSLFIGNGELQRDGTIKYKSKSDDRTYEIVNAVAKMMRIKLNKQNKKPWFGYEVPKCGKLILIKNGYEFEVFKKSNIVNNIFYCY